MWHKFWKWCARDRRWETVSLLSWWSLIPSCSWAVVFYCSHLLRHCQSLLPGGFPSSEEESWLHEKVALASFCSLSLFYPEVAVECWMGTGNVGGDRGALSCFWTFLAFICPSLGHWSPVCLILSPGEPGHADSGLSYSSLPLGQSLGHG